MLSAAQRSAIRRIHDGDTHIDSRILVALANRGYVTAGRKLALTPKGEREYRYIMRSGDGPEDLKELFRLGGRR